MSWDERRQVLPSEPTNPLSARIIAASARESSLIRRMPASTCTALWVDAGPEPAAGAADPDTAPVAVPYGSS